VVSKPVPGYVNTILYLPYKPEYKVASYFSNEKIRKTSEGFEVLTAVVMKSPVSWDITPCSQFKFDGLCYLLQVGFLLCLFFNPKDGGDMSLRNVS
jgi:hypothetical protein